MDAVNYTFFQVCLKPTKSSQVGPQITAILPPSYWSTNVLCVVSLSNRELFNQYSSTNLLYVFLKVQVTFFSYKIIEFT